MVVAEANIGDHFTLVGLEGDEAQFNGKLVTCVGAPGRRREGVVCGSAARRPAPGMWSVVLDDPAFAQRPALMVTREQLQSIMAQEERHDHHPGHRNHTHHEHSERAGHHSHHSHDVDARDSENDRGHHHHQTTGLIDCNPLHNLDTANQAASGGSSLIASQHHHTHHGTRSDKGHMTMKDYTEMLDREQSRLEEEPASVPTPRGHGHAETIIVNLSADPILEDADRRRQATEGYLGGWEPSVESGKVNWTKHHSGSQGKGEFIHHAGVEAKDYGYLKRQPDRRHHAHTHPHPHPGSDRELYGDDGVRQSKQESKISTRWSAESEQPHQTPLKDFTRHEREPALQRENAEARAVVLRAAAAREAMLREERGLTACHDGFVFANWLPPPPPPPPLSPRRLACSLSLPLARCLRYLLCSASATASPSLPTA